MQLFNNLTFIEMLLYIVITGFLGEMIDIFLGTD